MKQQHYFAPTLRDNPADAEVSSHQLMVRAGLIRQLASGVYSYLPLGYKVLRKIENIVREEMDKRGAQEILMPALHPAELWKETGRWDVYGPELMRLEDRHNREFALGPTHEEVITGLLRDDVNTYKKLPINLYQIQTKYRDEKRPRFGMLRAREFIMKDAYSFDRSLDGLDDSYQKMYSAYQSILSRCSLDFRAVEADSGAIGGTDTHEFMVLSDIGEDTIAYSTRSDYAANIEKAEVITTEYDQIQTATIKSMEEVDTPSVATIEQLVQFLDLDPRQTIKTLAYQINDQYVLALVRGDYELNEVKLKNLFATDMIEMLPEQLIIDELQSVPGFLGPVGMDDSVLIVADYSVKGMQNVVVGANQKDKHFINVQPDIDFTVKGYHDLRNVVQGDPSPDGHGEIQFAKGIEVGHVFKLGTKYSEAMGATFLDENGKEQPFIMGCYGIGISRILASLIEQHHDQEGMIWPASLTPFHVHLIPVNIKDSDQRQVADELYDQLKAAGYDILYDNRHERAGVKFKDADLLGLPLRVTIGKKASERIVECKMRKTGEVQEISVDKLRPFIDRFYTE